MASFKEPKKHLLIQFPGTMLVGIGQGRVTGSGDAQVFQFPLTASKTSGDLSEGMGTA
jgi:hypothetical protein